MDDNPEDAGISKKPPKRLRCICSFPFLYYTGLSENPEYLLLGYNRSSYAIIKRIFYE